MTSITTPSLENTAIVFLTHRVTEDVLERFATIVSQTPRYGQHVVLFDGATPKIEEIWRNFLSRADLRNVALISFRVGQLSKDLSVPLFSLHGIVPGSAHLPLVWLSRGLNHEFYWLVEDDVSYSGNWGHLFGGMANDYSDLLCSHLSAPELVPPWYFWRTLKCPVNDPARTDPFSVARKAFFPLYRISARALNTILLYQKLGWAGHFECLLPTILRVANLTLNDLNNVSSIPVYSVGAIDECEGANVMSSLRYRPPVTTYEMTSKISQIYHPIKDLTLPKRTLLYRSRRWAISLRERLMLRRSDRDSRIAPLLPDWWLQTFNQNHIE